MMPSLRNARLCGNSLAEISLTSRLAVKASARGEICGGVEQVHIVVPVRRGQAE